MHSSVWIFPFVGSPIIEDLAVLDNRTSTVMPLSWKVVTDGGSTPLVFTLFVRREGSDFQIAKNDIALNGEATIVYDIVDLDPITQYDFKVMAYNNRDFDGFSTNISTSGKTRGK